MIASILLFFCSMMAGVDSMTAPVTWLHAQEVHQDVVALHKNDTTLDSFRFFNPVLGKNPYLWLGNYGTASSYLIFNTPDNVGEVLHNPEPFAPYLINNDNIRYYKARKHFSEVFYEQGAKKEQVFVVTHTQNLSPNLNVGLDLKKSGAEGFYTRQKSNFTSYDFFLWFHNQNRRYNLFTNFIGNKLKVQENGGLNDLIFESGESKKNVPVALYNAERRNRDRGFFIQQSWDYGELVQKQDSLSSGDTLKAIANDAANLHARGQFSHSFSYKKQYSLFENPSPDYFFIDSITLDSTAWSSIRNKIQWTSMAFKKQDSVGIRKVKYTIGLMHELTEYWQIPYSRLDSGKITNQFNNLVLEGKAEGLIGRKISFGLEALQNVYGYNLYDHRYKGYAYLPFNKKNDYVGIAGSDIRIAPDFRLQQYSSNGYVWNNTFESSSYQSASLGLYLTHLGINATATYNKVRGYLYFDTNGLPAQYEGDLSIGVISIQKHVQWRNWHLQNRYTFQFADNDIIRMPQAVLVPSVYFEKRIFKKSTLTRIALDANYFSSYYAAAYIPETANFRLQDEKSLGNYPLLDLSVNMLVKRARVFFKLAHANAGLMKDKAYAALHYPYPGRAFQLGISWRFFD